MVVVTLVGVIASILVVAVDNDGVGDRIAAETAASEIAGALRFARSLAIKTGKPHGVRFDLNKQELKVYRLDTAPATPTPVYDVYHPIELQPYRVRLDSDRFPAELASHTINYVDHSGNFQRIDFMGTTGTPMRMSGGSIFMLKLAKIDVEHDDVIMSVNVAPYNGRVTVQ